MNFEVDFPCENSSQKRSRSNSHRSFSHPAPLSMLTPQPDQTSGAPSKAAVIISASSLALTSRRSLKATYGAALSHIPSTVAMKSSKPLRTLPRRPSTILTPLSSRALPSILQAKNGPLGICPRTRNQQQILLSSRNYWRSNRNSQILWQ